MIGTGCVRNTIANDYCIISFPILANCPMVGEEQKIGQDTQWTCRQIDEANAIYEKLCE